jgi:hypothetical protein
VEWPHSPRPQELLDLRLGLRPRRVARPKSDQPLKSAVTIKGPVREDHIAITEAAWEFWVVGHTPLCAMPRSEANWDIRPPRKPDLKIFPPQSLSPEGVKPSWQIILPGSHGVRQRFAHEIPKEGLVMDARRAARHVSIRRFLGQCMQLQFNDEKSGVRKPYDVHFLGFCFSCEAASGEVAVFPSGRAENRLKATIREMTSPNWGRSITSCMGNISR